MCQYIVFKKKHYTICDQKTWEEAVTMAQTTQISFRIDEDVKRNVESALEDMERPMIASIIVFLKKVGRERRIPFELFADPFCSENNIGYPEQKMADYKARKLSLEAPLIEERYVGPFST